MNDVLKHEIRTAILVDGGFYRKRAKSLFGEKKPKERADELVDYCYKHLNDKYENRYLYRVFYYDCPPSNQNIHNPINNTTISLAKTDEYKWMEEFLDELKHQRKFALRLGTINDAQLYYQFNREATKSLLNGKLSLENVKLTDFDMHIEQKGVDMMVGVDISSLAFKKQVNQIILISGDSDFVPASKQARREGIDFILDPMRSPIRKDLYEHIDGIRTPIYNSKV